MEPHPVPDTNMCWMEGWWMEGTKSEKNKEKIEERKVEGRNEWVDGQIEERKKGGKGYLWLEG